MDKKVKWIYKLKNKLIIIFLLLKIVFFILSYIIKLIY